MPFDSFPLLSDTTKTTDFLEGWPVNAVERALMGQGRQIMTGGQPQVREGQWLRKISLIVYGATPAAEAPPQSPEMKKYATDPAHPPDTRTAPPTVIYPHAGNESVLGPPSNLRPPAPALGGDTAGLDLSLLRIVFSVKKFTNSSPNMFQARVYNLSKPPGPDTVGKVKQYRRVQLAAGYRGESNYGIIFDGTVIMYLVGKENPVDSYIDIYAGDGDNLNQAAVNLTWAPGSLRSQRLRDKINATGFKLGEINLAEGDDQKAIRSVSYIGMADRGIRIDTNASQSQFWIDDGKANVISWKGYREGTIVELAPDTGLIGIPKVTPQGIEAMCLLNPKLRLGGLVRIKTDLISGIPYLPGSKVPWSGAGPLPTKAGVLPFSAATVNEPALGQTPEQAAQQGQPVGVYKILLLDHYGDNRGNPWYSAMVCAAAGANGELLQKGYTGSALSRSVASIAPKEDPYGTGVVPSHDPAHPAPTRRLLPGY